MEELPGSVGTSSSLSLRVGQTLMAVGSLLFMTVGVQFYSYTAFRYLVTIMALVVPWSMTLAVVDLYSLLLRQPLRRPRLLLAICLGDWMVSSLVLAAACSTASVMNLLKSEESLFGTEKMYNRCQISSVLAFFTWCLSLASSLFNFWLLLPSLSL